MSADPMPAPEVVERQRRALTEHLAADVHAGAVHEVHVYSRGTRYVVDLSVPVCECPDMLHRRPPAGCKHVLFAELVLGRRPIPGWVDDREAVNPVLLAQRERYADLEADDV